MFGRLGLAILLFSFFAGFGLFQQIGTAEEKMTAVKQGASAIVGFGEFASVLIKAETTFDNLVVTGDVMLGRDVAAKMEERGDNWPFVGLVGLFADAAVLINFEAAIPKEYEPTPALGMNLAVDVNSLSGLVASKVSHISLANNHTLDSDEEGYQNTVNQLQLRGFNVAGHPSEISSSSVFYLNLEDKRVGVVNINATYGYPDESEWLPTVSELVRNSDLQFVYIHWGEEYKLVHNKTQAAFAHALTDAGIDVIIGTHPHVVQDIERYNDSLIFYSLGNLIFDQYFSDEVQNGLVLKFSLAEDELLVDLVPVTSLNTPTQPRIMGVEESAIFLKALAERSEASLAENIAKSSLSLQF